MSSQRGNVKRQRPQRHMNDHKFDPLKHASKKKEKELVELKPEGVCQRCYEVIMWKIKYKKYKQMTQPAKCVKCGERNVKRSYYVLCDACIAQSNCCGKCCESHDLVNPIPDKEDAAVQREIQAQVDSLSERKRRTFYRYVEREQNGGSTNCGCCKHEDEGCDSEHAHSGCARGNPTRLLEKLKVSDSVQKSRGENASSCDDDDYDDEDCDSDDCEDEDDDDDENLSSER